jgi:hypothetical protein
MPRYYFNVHYLGRIVDEVGEELPDNESAWELKEEEPVGKVIGPLRGPGSEHIRAASFTAPRHGPRMRTKNGPPA